MNVGKTLFAQIMEFVPWTSFSRIVARCGGESGVRRLTCSEQFRVMTFAHLTWRESLRDIEVTLGANASKLYAMGFRHSIHRSTLADANESRDWRIWPDLASVLIRRIRKLYLDEDLELDLKNTVYALDATTIDLCLSLFKWAPFRKAKAAVKLHTVPPLTIAALYKSRWQVELFFKWIKQHLRIKKFLGNSENAVKTQIWYAVSTYVFIAIVKKELQLNASLYTLLQILSVSVF